MEIDRMNKGSWGKVRAFFDLATSDGFIIKGFKLIEGINGLFVSMPSQKGNDDEYTIDRQYPMQYDIPSLDEVEYSYLDSLLTAGTSKWDI